MHGKDLCIMQNHTSDWSSRLDDLLFGKHSYQDKKDAKTPIRIKYKNHSIEEEMPSEHKMASAFVDTRNYVASADTRIQMGKKANKEKETETEEMTGQSEEINGSVLATTGSAFTRSRGTGPYGRVSYLPYNQQFYNNRRRIGTGVETSGTKFLDYVDNSYGTGFGHNGVNRVGYGGMQDNFEAQYGVNYGSNYGTQAGKNPYDAGFEECPEEYGINTNLLIAVALGTFVAFFGLYNQVIGGRKLRSIATIGLLQLIMTGCTIIAFPFLPSHFLTLLIIIVKYYPSPCKDLSVL